MLRRFRSPFLARVTLFTLLAQLIPNGFGGVRGMGAAAPTASPDARAFRVITAKTLRLAADGKTSVPLPTLRRDRLYSITVALLGAPAPESPAVTVALRVGDQKNGEKTLHAGDPDMYAVIRPPQDGGDSRIEIDGAKPDRNVPVTVKVVEWNAAADTAANVAYKSGGGWKQAAPMTLGEVVFGSGDLAPYIPTTVPETTRYYDASRKAETTTAVEAGTGAAEDWLVFRHDDDTPKLVFFQLDLPERDNIPPDISVFVEKNGRLEAYETGADPVAGPHEVQALPANKFITRTITRGTYYVRIIANHPEWQLRTQVLPVPPYADPRLAVSAGIDYLLGAGDSWHANTPRAGARLNRVGNVHAETAQCVACHPTQFTVRAAQTARENGYLARRREALRFLAERMAENPRPLPGHKGANWVRMISAPGNVSSRLADLVATQAEQTGDTAAPTDVHEGAYRYLALYYKGRTTLPGDETNGNQPLISPYEVLYHAGNIFQREYRRTGSAEAKAYTEQARTLLAQNRHKNLIDLCWQTIAMAKSDPARFKDQIEANCARLLSEQRADGQWAASFDPQSAPVEFQTGHALYALAVAGYRTDHPQIQKAVGYLMQRQQPFGGWFDPLQSYENFRTPFRESQFAVMALSQLYPASNKGRGGGDAGFVSPPERLNLREPMVLLKQLDSLWIKPNRSVLAQTIGLLRSDEPMVRQMAATALGRIGDASAVAPLAAALGDTTKMVQRTAAVALRQLGRRGIGREAIADALQSPDSRVRWGAVRIFAYHFRPLASSPKLAQRLLKLTEDPSVRVRLAALQSVWQWYYWTDDAALREQILDRVLARLAAPEHPWIARSAREAIYNMADENVRYLYNNWIPALGDAADREAALAGQRAHDERIARKLAAALTTGNSSQREAILRGLGEFHLRRVREQKGRYARIGNDVEQIRFTSDAARLLESAIAQAMSDPSPAVRRHAVIAAFTLRDNGPLPVAATLISRLADPEPEVRAAAEEFYRAVPLDMTAPRTADAVTVLLQSPFAPARQAARALLVSPEGAVLAGAPGVVGAIREYVRTADEDALPEALKVVTAFPALQKDPEIRRIVIRSLTSAKWETRAAALELALSSTETAGDPEISAKLNAFFGDPSPEARKTIIELARRSPAARRDTRMVSALGNALRDTDSDLRALAQEIVQKDETLRSAPPIQTALQARNSTATADRSLDYAYFKRNVMPVFARRSVTDGNACVSCHFNHNLFKVTPPGARGRFTEAQIRETLRSAMKMADLRAPEKSLLLLKPLSSSASEGVVNAATVAHGGGQRWSGPDDPDYRVVLAWLNGAKAEEGGGNSGGAAKRARPPKPAPGEPQPDKGKR